MKSIDQIRMGITKYYDTEIRGALPGVKGAVYGMIIGTALARPEALIAKIAPAAQTMGIMDENGNVELEALADEAKKQIAASGGKIDIEIGINPINVADKDRFVFTAADVDKLMRCIDDF